MLPYSANRVEDRICQEAVLGLVSICQPRTYPSAPDQATPRPWGSHQRYILRALDIA